jgi:acyl-CoA synthetase (AMP-forming)/AMP-acid ligase II
MANWINLGKIFPVNAAKFPDNVAFMDAERRYTFPESNLRINRLAHALMSLGIGRGNTFSCLLENCIEICELYVAAAKIGAVINPINFRLTPREVGLIADDADAKALVFHDRFAGVADEIRDSLPRVTEWVSVGSPGAGSVPYEELVAHGTDDEPQTDVEPSDTWILLYTSGTTGRPKGVVRSHESYVAFYLINGCDFRFSPRDVVLTAMPLCHVNTTFFSFTATYLGGANYIHPCSGFDAREILRIIDRRGITFVSLIPTHYSLILAVPPEERARYDLGSLSRLLCSSAPARVEQKRGILETFKGVELYEGYGSTEAGIVTTLTPAEQLTHPGSIGRESSGTARVKILDEDGSEVPDGEIGELYSAGPMMFDRYHKMPEQTARAFRGDYFSAGDMARRDSDGYYHLVDRKKNLIITGGEHVYPSEVEKALGSHPAVFDAAVVGVSDPLWGEAVTAVVALHDGATATEDEIIDFSKQHLAHFKCPKRVVFIASDEMPRTGSGKILHRVLRERLSGG